MNRFLLPILVLFASSPASSASEARSQRLWEIGQGDRGNAEFALAPGGYAQFKDDGFFVVGSSDPKKDWPYVQPGPVDSWAGGRPHTFLVLFGLKTSPAEGDFHLDLHLLDTHGTNPPTIRVEVNGLASERSLPAGAGDASVHGRPDKGTPRELGFTFPAQAFKTRDNEIRITTLKGSWLLYDWVGLTAPAGAELGPVQSRTLVDEVRPVRALQERDGRAFQPVIVTLRHFGADTEAVVRVEGVPGVAGILPARVEGVPPSNRGPEALGTRGRDTRDTEARDISITKLHLQSGRQETELMVTAVATETKRQIAVEVDGKTVASREVTLKPVPKLTVYITPHSHTDIGYTEIQTAIEDKQVQNLVDGIAAAKRTADYPPGSRFVWNVEVLWAADLYLRRLDEQQRAEFLEAVQKGQVVLNGMYLNELTGLCRPEELVRLFRYCTQLAEQTGVPIDAVMTSDVPGQTWGTVTAMAHAGIRYFSTAPNYFDRIGTILKEWENRPFYWVGPDGKSKVLVWIPFWGYAMSHRYGKMSPGLVEDLYAGLEKRAYPFDIAYVRWSGHGDNAVPDPAICEFVKDWNAKYAWPRFIICGTSEAFRAFEQRYGEKLPTVRGDWTPYWEDGAGSSALETAMNRASSDRLTQAEALFAMLQPAAYPGAAFEDAWNKVLLYSEHTWGAWCSVTEPQRKETLEQWEIKKSYADAADKQSRDLLAAALGAEPVAPLLWRGRPALASRGHLGLASSSHNGPVPTKVQGQDALATGAGPRDFSTLAGAVNVFNTLSWPRTELVRLSKELSSAGDRVLDDKGKPVPSQRLTSGELVFLARAVPPFGARRYVCSVPVRAYQETPDGVTTNRRAVAQGSVLDNDLIRARVDEKTGGIVELTAKSMKSNFADTRGGEALNDYLYLIGDDLKDVQRNGPVTIRIGENGPLVASLLIESAAPGCRKLVRELRVVAGQDYVEIINTVDKERLQAKNYRAKEGKESLNFAFPFAVPEGEVLMDLPLGLMRPEADQMPSACKNWFSVGRWADVSNRRYGVTWVTLDTPLLQVGGLTATLLNSQYDPNVWRPHVEPTQKLYAWAMNNHWGTNYRAYQEGPTLFRFILRPHGRRDLAEASRFATGFSQPLAAVPARSEKAFGTPLLQVEPDDVLVTALKPSDDGKALIVRLFGASTRSRSASVRWGEKKPQAVFLSDTSERAGRRVGCRIEVPASGLVTLRAEF